MTAPNITGTPLSSTSFTVSWIITDPDHNYIITWTNLHTGVISSMTVAENTNSYTVTGLNSTDNYIVTVTANNLCGMMMSGLITVYGKNVHIVHNIYMCTSGGRSKARVTSPTFKMQGQSPSKIRKYAQIL